MKCTYYCRVLCETVKSLISKIEENSSSSSRHHHLHQTTATTGPVSIADRSGAEMEVVPPPSVGGTTMPHEMTSSSAAGDDGGGLDQAVIDEVLAAKCVVLKDKLDLLLRTLNSETCSGVGVMAVTTTDESRATSAAAASLEQVRMLLNVWCHCNHKRY